jgi:hypothetical protein
MYPKLNLPIAILWIVSLILLSGCDERATQIAREAADRQAQQNTAMAELNKEVAGGTRRLVEADAKARQEIVGVHRDLQAERSRLDTGWKELELERRQIAGQRRTESLLAPVIQAAALTALAVVLIGFCFYVLVANRRSDDTDAQVNELLICELLPDAPLLLSSDQSTPPLLGQSPPNDPSAE